MKDRLRELAVANRILARARDMLSQAMGLADRAWECWSARADCRGIE